MKPSIYPIVSDQPGSLFIMPKPSGEWLDEDVAHYRSMGANTIISMLEPAEIEELSLQNEGVACADNQLDFINFPIQDRGLPDRDGFKDLISIVTKRLRNNEGVAVHCRAGIGRSGMLVCCALAEFLGSAVEAMDVVSRSRGVEVPDTEEQREFIVSIVQELKD